MSYVDQNQQMIMAMRGDQQPYDDSSSSSEDSSEEEWTDDGSIVEQRKSSPFPVESEDQKGWVGGRRGFNEHFNDRESSPFIVESADKEGWVDGKRGFNEHFNDHESPFLQRGVNNAINQEDDAEEQEQQEINTGYMEPVFKDYNETCWYNYVPGKGPNPPEMSNWNGTCGTYPYNLLQLEPKGVQRDVREKMRIEERENKQREREELKRMNQERNQEKQREREELKRMNQERNQEKQRERQETKRRNKELNQEKQKEREENRSKNPYQGRPRKRARAANGIGRRQWERKIMGEQRGRPLQGKLAERGRKIMKNQRKSKEVNNRDDMLISDIKRKIKETQKEINMINKPKTGETKAHRNKKRENSGNKKKRVKRMKERVKEVNDKKDKRMKRIIKMNKELDSVYKEYVDSEKTNTKKKK